MHLLEIICADIIFKLCRYAHIRIKRGWGAMTVKGGSLGAKGSHDHQSARKLHKINIFLDITRNKSNFYL